MKTFIILLSFLFAILQITEEIGKGFSMIKELDGFVYVGGRNRLSSYKYQDKNLELLVTKTYEWPISLMNGSDIGFELPFQRLPTFLPNINDSLIFDNCLNWRQDHWNESVRVNFVDYQHFQYHTPSGDWDTMNYICMNSFIKSVEILNNDTLWVCGTFGAFPRAFSVNKTTLDFLQFVDVNMMSCARYMDESMVSYIDDLNNLYVGSGWGLYRPDVKDPDIPDNNSTMLYADWRLSRNLFTLPAIMSWILSSDVNFINFVKETKDHLYFFGHEINNQYGLNNQEDRHAWQSFMLRICKNDLGFKYVPIENNSEMSKLINHRYYRITKENKDYAVSLIHIDSMNKEWYKQTVHLPTKHFVNSQKLNFGCYIGKRPRAISDNHYWGDTNVVYINKIADVVFDPSREIKFQTKNNNKHFGCSNNSHSLLPLIGIFNTPGLAETQIKPTGALCQLQINSNVFNEIGSKKNVYHETNMLNVKNAYEEIMAISSTSFSNFYSRTIHRTNGFTLYPYWNQGVLIGENTFRLDYNNAFDNVGKCQNKTFYDSLNKEQFLKLQNFSNTAWPNELPNKLSSIPSAICQYSAIELYSFNATFLIPGVEFKRIFILQENITNYNMNKLRNRDDDDQQLRRSHSPLMVVSIISANGVLYRVVLCDFDSGMENHGINKTDNSWYNWCIFRHTDQPYLYRQYAPMEKREHGKSYQYRASSLLLEKTIVQTENSFPENRDPQIPVVKDVLRNGNILHVLTANNIYSVDFEIMCDKYKRCIDCASDPMCMWNTSSGMCITYEDNTFQDSLFIQDVLDRGFQCAHLINTTVHSIKPVDNMILICSNGNYWRGPIVWKMYGYKTESNRIEGIYYNQHNMIMTIYNYSKEKHGDRFSCHGIRDDYDKLYDETEYEGHFEQSEITLDEFHIQSKITLKIVLKSSPWKPIGIALIVISLLFLLVIIIEIYFRKSNKVGDRQFQQTKIIKVIPKQELNGLQPSEIDKPIIKQLSEIDKPIIRESTETEKDVIRQSIEIEKLVINYPIEIEKPVINYPIEIEKPIIRYPTFIYNNYYKDQ